MHYQVLETRLKQNISEAAPQVLEPEFIVHGPDLRALDDMPERCHMLIFPIEAFAGYDADRLTAGYGANRLHEDGVVFIDVNHPELRISEASPLLQSIINEAKQRGVLYLALLPEEDYSLSPFEFIDERYVERDSDAESCVGEFMCPACAHRDHFSIEVEGADPHDVDMMESQSRIQARVARGELEIVRFMADFYPDGSEDTVSSTEWVEDGEMVCPSCQHSGVPDSFRTLHNCIL